MRNSLVIVAVLVLALPAAVASGAGTLTMSKNDCRKLVRHQPSADVAYRPGVDARGRRVAPADLGGGTNITVPDEIEIRINVELNETIGAAASGLYEPEARMGKVVYRNGRAWYNGQPLETDANSEVVEACKRRLKSRR
jgi:hypothetical protein